MRRLGSANWPEVVRVSEDSPESSFRELDDVFLQTQARIWLGEVLHIRFPDDTDIADLIADGELLFQVSKVVWKMLLKKNVDMKTSKVFIHERTSFAKGDGRYMPYPKVDSFLKICQILELTSIDLFSPSDVVEKKNIRRVCMCIRSFSKKARLRNLNVADFDKVTYTIAMPTNLVGGIRRYLEQARRISSSSSWDGIYSRRSNRKKVYTEEQDQCHDSLSESDQADSNYAEMQIERPSVGTSQLFFLDQDLNEESLEDDQSAPDSQEGFLTESCKDVESLSENQNAGIHPIIAKPAIQPLDWSENPLCGGHVSYQNSVSSSNNSAYILETRTREKEADAISMPFENYFSRSCKCASHANPGENKEETEVLVACKSEQMSNQEFESYRRGTEYMVLEESQEDDPTKLVLPFGRCNKMQILDKKNEDLKREENHNKVDCCTYKENIISQGVPYQDLTSPVYSCLQARQESTYANNRYIADAEVPGVPSLGTRDFGDANAYEYEKDDEHYVDVFSTTNHKAVTKASVVTTAGQCDSSNKGDDYADVLMHPDAPACKAIEKCSNNQGLCSKEQGIDSNGSDEVGSIASSSLCFKREAVNLQLPAIKEMNCSRILSSTLDPLQVCLGLMDSGKISTISTLESIKWLQRHEFDAISETDIAPFESQSTRDISDCYLLRNAKHSDLSNTCTTSIDETKAASRVLLSAGMLDKKEFLNSILENDTNQLYQGPTEYSDETEVAKLLSVTTCKIYSNKVDSVNAPRKELILNECDSVTEESRKTKLDKKNNCIYNSLALDRKNSLKEREDGTSDWIMKSECIQEPSRGIVLATNGIDNKYNYPLSSSEGNDLMGNDLAETKPPRALKFYNADETEIELEAEEAGFSGGFSSTYRYYLSKCQCMELKEGATNSSCFSDETVSSYRRDISKSNCHISVQAQSNEDSIQNQQMLSISATGCIQEEERVIADEKNLEIEGKVSVSLDEHSASRNSKVQKSPIKDQKRGKKLLMAVAGGVTAIGTLFVLLHVSAGKRDIKRIKLSSIYKLTYQFRRFSYKTSWKLASLM